ncbi:hypothetical protein CR513_14865, partial [Mucuna pruriens]
MPKLETGLLARNNQHMVKMKKVGTKPKMTKLKDWDWNLDAELAKHLDVESTYGWIDKLQFVHLTRSETKSSLTLSHSSMSESALSRDSVGYNSTESVPDPSLPRASRHSTHLDSSDPLHALDPEIKITLHRLRKVRSFVLSNNNSSNFVSNSDNTMSVTNDSNFYECNSSNINSDCNFGLKPKPMENNDQTLKEWATSDVCNQYPQLELAQSYELKSGLIHLLPKFHGLASEDPHKHLKEFHVVCSKMRQQGYLKMKAFPFFLDRVAKD